MSIDLVNIHSDRIRSDINDSIKHTDSFLDNYKSNLNNHCKNHVNYNPILKIMKKKMKAIAFIYRVHCANSSSVART